MVVEVGSNANRLAVLEVGHGADWRLGLGPGSLATHADAPDADDSVAEVAVAGINRIAGVPMNWATKVFAGFSYTSRGVPNCWSFPSSMTPILPPMVIASTWSWVT